MSAETKLPPSEPVPSYQSAGSHFRYGSSSSPVKIAGSGEGIQPDSSVFRGVGAGADLTEPEAVARLDDRASHVLPLLPRPEELEPGRPTSRGGVPGPSWPPSVSSPMLKNLISGSEPPFAFLSTSGAVGPCTWKR